MSTKSRYQIIISTIGIKAEGSKPLTSKSATIKPFISKSAVSKLTLKKDNRESKEDESYKNKKEDKGKGLERDEKGDMLMYNVR